MTKAPFRDWLAEKLGTRMWVVAPRLTQRLRSEDYEVAISQEKFTALRQEWLGHQSEVA